MGQTNWEDDMSKTGYRCPFEEEHIHYAEEVVLFEVRIVKAVQGKVESLHVMNDAQTTFRYPPIFVLYDGWEKMDEQLRQVVEDLEPVREPHELIRCEYCGSSICEGEVYLLATMGAINRSRRMPNGVHAGNTFEDRDSRPTIACIACALLLHQEVHALWGTPLKQWKECEEGTTGRCWRGGCGAMPQSCQLTTRPHST